MIVILGMDIGNALFSSLDSPFRTLRKVAKVLVIFLFVFMPITFWHLFMGAVHAGTVKAQHELNQVLQPMMPSLQPTPTTVPSSGD